MKRTSALASRLREVLLDGHWIANTNYKEQLSNLSLAQATQKVGNLNTIAALTFHINYYLEGLLQVLRGGPLEMSDKFSFALPPLQSEAEWRRMREELFRNAEAFAMQVEQMPEAKLDAPFIDERYGSYQRNIEVVIEHSYYHLGQVTLIKKLGCVDSLEI